MGHETARRGSRARLALVAALLFGCGGGGGGDPDLDAGPQPDAGPSADAGAADGGGGPIPDAAPLTLEAVPGDFTYVAREPGVPGSAHLYAAEASGSARWRITREPGGWTFSAVGPDNRYVAAVRRGDADGDGRPDPDGRRAVWLIDVKARREYALTPEACDAGIGGLGWRDEVRIMFAMRCGDEPSAIYLVNRDNRGRERENLLRIGGHPEWPVRDVFPAVGTPVYAYVVDARRCEGDACVAKPEIWLADHDEGVACRVTDGDPAMRDATTVTGDAVRLGDHHPSLGGDMSSITFSRNVAGKPAGPTGHHDLFRIGVDRAALYGRAESCGVTGTLTALSGAFIDERYPLPDGATVVGDEMFAQAAAADALPGTVLYAGIGRGADGAISARVYLADVDGTRVPLTPATLHATHPRWIVERFTRPHGG